MEMLFLYACIGRISRRKKLSSAGISKNVKTFNMGSTHSHAVSDGAGKPLTARGRLSWDRDALLLSKSGAKPARVLKIAEALRHVEVEDREDGNLGVARRSRGRLRSHKCCMYGRIWRRSRDSHSVYRRGVVTAFYAEGARKSTARKK